MPRIVLYPVLAFQRRVQHRLQIRIRHSDRPIDRLRVALTAIAAASLVLVGGGSAAARPVSPDFWGVNAGHQLWALDNRADHLELMRRSGVESVRYDADWQRAEPRPPNPLTGARAYDWRFFDRIAGELAARRLRWYPMLDYSTTWAGAVPGNRLSAPRELGDYAAYARAFALRYGRGGSFWRQRPQLPYEPVVSYEVWNEPNLPIFWQPAPRPDRYADMFAAAQEAIRGVDRRARVVVGGLADPAPGAAISFVRAMYRHRPDLRRRVDAVGLHVYTPRPKQGFRRVVAFRRALDALGERDVPLDVNEFGWPKRAPGAPFRAPSERARAAYYRSFAKRLARARDCKITHLAPYAWVTSERDPRQPPYWYGIANHDATPKRSGKAYLGVARRGRGLRRAKGKSLCKRSVPVEARGRRSRR